MVHPDLHIKPSLYLSKKVQTFQIFKQNLIILIHSSFIAFLHIWVPWLWMRGRWVGGYGGCPRFGMLTKTCYNIHVNKLQMATNMFIMISMCVHMHACMTSICKQN